MTRYLLIIVLALIVGGCAGLTNSDDLLYGFGQQRKLSQAATLMKEGQSSAAREVLDTLIAEPSIPGITDEALFRLSLLKLAAIHEQNSVNYALQDLLRLKKEYPSGDWAPLALPLTEYLAAAEYAQEKKQQETKKLRASTQLLVDEIKELRDANQSLTRENRELNQRIDKLKSLELEIGRNNKPLPRPLTPSK